LHKLPQSGIIAGMASNQADMRALTFTMGDRLRKARELAGLKQEELAEILGVARMSMYRWERGVSVPRRPVLISWALRTGVPYEWLLTGELRANDPEPGQTSWMSWYLHRPSVEGAA